MFPISRSPRLIALGLMVASSLLLLLLLATHVIRIFPPTNTAYLQPAPLANAYRQPLQLSSDPYANKNSQHQTEVEPDTYSYGSTLVTAFQAGRFSDGGSSNIGWATSTDGGRNWSHGFLPATTNLVGGPYTRVSDSSVSYDAAHHTWLITALGVRGETGTLYTQTVLATLSTDGGLTWSLPVKIVDGGSTYFDKSWITCDNTTSSPFYGHCYVEWDNDDKGGLILMSTSTNGGHSWSVAQTTADQAQGLGGQPLVQPDGTVVVPISSYADSRMLSFTSTNGGVSWSKTVVVAKITGSVLATAGIDAAGKIYLVWANCDFEQNCKGGKDESEQDLVLNCDRNCNTGRDESENDLVMTTSTDGVQWSPVQVIAVDPLGNGIDHVIPGLGVDQKTSGNSARLALAFYYHAVNCNNSCDVYAGFVSSSDGGKNWTNKVTLAGPMNWSWLPLGRNKVGDYISTSFCDGNAYPVFSIAAAPNNGHFNEAMYTITGGLMV